MKKLMIASLGLSLLTGTAMFAQDTAAGSSDAGTMKKKGKKKKSKSTEGSSSTTSTSK
jgi:hypothetical protein